MLFSCVLTAYCNAGQLHRAEGVISEMQENGIPPSMHLKLHSSEFSVENCRCPDPGVRIPTSKCCVFPRPR